MNFFKYLLNGSLQLDLVSTIHRTSSSLLDDSSERSFNHNASSVITCDDPEPYGKTGNQDLSTRLRMPGGGDHSPVSSSSSSPPEEAKNFRPNQKVRIMFVLPYRLLAQIGVGLPLFAFIFCVSWSIIVNFEETTSTHCGVTNILPSISAAVGAFEPQRFVWRISILLHTPIRYFTAILYHRRYYLNRYTLALNLVEITSLLGLSIFDSTNYFRKRLKNLRLNLKISTLSNQSPCF